MTMSIDDTQRKAAKVVGLMYLLAMAASIFTEEYIRGALIVYDNAALTAQNIMANQILFRIGVAGELVTFAFDITLITSLYVILSPVNRYLALLATFFRLAAVSLALVMATQGLEVLRLLSGAEYLKAFEPERLQAMARLVIGAHGSAYNIVFVFLGVGSTLYAILWMRSDYVPKALAILGIVGSAMLGVGSFTIVIYPALAKLLSLTYMLPLGIFEITMGFWLLIKGLRPPALR